MGGKKTKRRTKATFSDRQSEVALSEERFAATFDILSMIADVDIPDWMLVPYIREDPERSKPFAPAFQLRDAQLREIAISTGSLLDALNKREKKKQRKRFDKLIASGYTGAISVSEGDSWFVYPVRIEEVTDHLLDRYAVYSLGAAADTLTEVITQNEYLPPIHDYGATIFLLSAGGNDVIGNISECVYDFEQGRRAEDYPTTVFTKALSSLEAGYRGIFTAVTNTYPNVRILCHGYDYAIPRPKGKWLGEPMAKKRITDPQLQVAIVRVLVDRFNDLLKTLCRDFSPNATHVDCRGSVPAGLWYDELHPSSDGFKYVAAKFADYLGK